MSTNDNILAGNSKPNVNPITPKPISQAPKTPSNPSQSSIPTLVKQMQQVKTDTPEAKINETTISDGNGGRITLDDQTKRNNSSGKGSTILGNLFNRKW